MLKHWDRHDAEAAAGTELLWLLGQPHLGDYLAFVETKVIGGESIDPRALADEWRAANDLFADLEQAEAGIADSIRCRKAPAGMAGAIARLEANRWFRDSFDNLPYAIELVELKKLVVSQLHVEASYDAELKARVGPEAGPQALFDFCLPLDRPMPPVTVERLGSSRYLFSSPSTDFRGHEPRLYRDPALLDAHATSPAAALFGVMVGFGSNFMSGVRSGKRILLQNGYHRAFALMRAGFTHGWCIVETVTRKDELKLTASEEVADDPEFYFATKRPPILRDFLDPRLVKPLLVRAMTTQVEVEINVKSSTATRF
jgi:hypothetical protein